MTLVPVARLAAHVRELAAAFDVLIIEEAAMPPDRAQAALMKVMDRATGAIEIGEVRAIRIAPVIDETTYAAALHELGHMVAPLGMLDGTEGLTIEAERAAWEWAQHYALDWTPLMDSIREMSFGSYTRPAAPAPAPAPPTTRVETSVSTFARTIGWGQNRSKK